ncbi:MAG: Co2+/Mg2+ efflux protein ApaG [Bacteroidota bacterium]|nr:Co2+/Mg2+ efflux protein ApaG [Bacteroidota bacterium]
MVWATTRNIKVSVKTGFQANHSDFKLQKFVYAYHVSIENLSQESVRLLSRIWIIKDAHSPQKAVTGKGVVGEQPILHPQQSFEYSSWCPIESPMGNMKGLYTFQYLESKKTFKVKVPEFLFCPDYLRN